MSKRAFKDITRAEDFANDMVFGGDDPAIVAEVVEVWPNEYAWNRALLLDGPAAWGTLYVLWGTEDEVEAEAEALGEYIDRKGMTGVPA